MTRISGARDFESKLLFALAVFYTLYFARAVVLPIALAALLALILGPAVGALHRAGLPRTFSAALIVACVVIAIAFALQNLLDPANHWIDELPRHMALIEHKLRGIKSSVQNVTQAAERVQRITAPNGTKPVRVEPQDATLANRIFSHARSALISGGATLGMLYFLLAFGEDLLKRGAGLFSRRGHRRIAVAIARTVQRDMSRYLFTITCINAGLGIATAMTMYWLGVPNPALWGTVAAVLNYVPYIGAATNLVILTFVAFVALDDAAHALWVPGIQLCLHIVEGQFLTPILTARSLLLDPLIVVFGMLFWGWLWGITGALMAVPLLMAWKIVCMHVDSLAQVGSILADRSSIRVP